MRALVGPGRDQPQLDGARIVGQQRGRHHDQAVAGRGDGGDEVRLAAASGERRHQRRARGRDAGRYRRAPRCSRPRASAEAMPKPRQNARLCHTDAGRAAARRGDRGLDARPGGRRRRDRRDRVGKPGQPLLPERHLGGERRLLRHAALDLAPLLGAEHAQHVFGGDEVAAVRRGPWCRRRSSFETGSQFQQPAPDPALHRAERHAHARGQFLVGGAVEERRADGGRVPRFQFLQAAGETLLLLRQLDALDRDRGGIADRVGGLDRLACGG